MSQLDVDEQIARRRIHDNDLVERVEALEEGGGGGLGAADFVTNEVPTGLVDGSNAVFTLAGVPVEGSEQVYLNGLLQDEGAADDYEIAADEITFVSAPIAGSKILVNYIISE